MTRCFLLALFLCGCRYLGPVSPEVTPDRPALLSNGGESDPTRQQRVPGRPCVVECGPGYRCNERTAQCEADVKPSTRDGGLSWLP